VTDDADALLEAIRADPDDLERRIAYADWLQAHGDTSRAEFVRLQCEMALLPEDDPLQPELKLREQALLTEHGKLWQGYLPTRQGLGDWKFIYGLPGGVSAQDEHVFLENAEAIFNAAPIQSLTLRRLYDIHALANSPYLEQLRDLTVIGDPLTDAGVAILAASPHLAHLRSLRLDGHKIEDGGARALAASPHLTNLFKLSLDLNQIGPAGARSLAAAPHWSRLARLSLRNNRIGDAGALSLAASPYLPALTELSLDANRIGPDGAKALAVSPARANLTVLSLSDNRIGDAGLASIAASPHLGQLTSLYVDRCGIGVSGVKALADAPLSKLRSLYAEGNPIGDGAASALIGSPYLSELRLLALSDRPLSRPGRSALQARFGNGLRLK
jgi:uncharacterized protein (TIGR02996 family)